ncbi:hypothetical protein HOE91_05810 [archaeon]|jgi:hypothetical protein|nr:hypothetical protein [archaeon]
MLLKSQKNLNQLTFTISLIGIFLLLILSNILTPSYKTIQEIKQSSINTKITTIGKITNINNKQTFQIITITDTPKSQTNSNQQNKITIIADKITSLKTNQIIELVGTTQIYKNQIQIQANKIYLIKKI